MTPVAAVDPPMSEVSRIVGVFFSPGQTFADVIKRPRWYIPVIILTVCSLAFVYLYSQHVGWERVVRQQMEQSPRTQNMSTEDREKAVTAGVKFAPIVGFVQATLLPLIGVSIVAG